MQVGTDIRVAMSPLHSVFMLVTDALFGARTVAPHVQSHLVRRIAATAPVRDAFGPIVASRFRAVPDIVVPMVHHTDPTADDHAGQLAAARDTVITGFAADPEGLPQPWRPIAENPKPWLDAMGRFSQAAWDVVAPLWTAAGPLLDHEVARIGSAVVRGQGHTVITTLSPRLRLVDGTVTLDGRSDAAASLSGRELVLIPMLAGDATVVLQADLPGVVQIGYPLPGGSALVGATGASMIAPTRVEAAHTVRPVEAMLAGLLGERRAAILQHLDRPRTMGDLAARLGIAPATVTHHCDHLEAAGLVQRVRHGRSVLVGRSERAATLLDTMGAAAD